MRVFQSSAFGKQFEERYGPLAVSMRGRENRDRLTEPAHAAGPALPRRSPAVCDAARLPGRRRVIPVEMSGHFEEHVTALEKIVFRDLGCGEHVRHQLLEDVDSRSPRGEPVIPTVLS